MPPPDQACGGAPIRPLSAPTPLLAPRCERTPPTPHIRPR
ncbi:hypothetical protein chiPu_0033463, partial [Chiloscyllium punctatum]|nr:hypothetical protein [Chiloscyllium punctatum]